MNRNRWLLFSAFVFALAALALLAGAPISVSSQAPTPSPTGLLHIPPLDVGPTATMTPTRARSLLLSPTPTATEDLPEPMLTLTALNSMFEATFSNRPTLTPGPSEIKLTGKPHFVEFYADWCAPCRVMRPAVNAMKEKYAEQLTFWDIDVDNPASTGLTRKHTVVAIPLVVLLDKEGNVFMRLEGLQEQAELERAIKDLLAANQ